MRAAILLVAPIVLLLFPAVGQTQAAEHYDGRWWRTITQAERTGFVEGTVDCFVGDYGGSPWFGGDSTFAQSIARTTIYYQGDSTRSREPVLNVLLANEHPAPVSGEQGFEHGRGHWVFDGMNWKEMTVDGNHAEQYGYLEGYLSCYQHLFPRKAKIFTRSPTEYQVLVTRWYRFDEKSGNADPKRLPIPIVQVLHRVASGHR